MPAKNRIQPPPSRHQSHSMLLRCLHLCGATLQCNVVIARDTCNQLYSAKGKVISDVFSLKCGRGSNALGLY